MYYVHSLGNELVFYNAWIHIHVYTLVEFSLENRLMGKVEHWKYPSQKRAKYFKLGVRLFKFNYISRIECIACQIAMVGFSNFCCNKNDSPPVMRQKCIIVDVSIGRPLYKWLWLWRWDQYTAGNKSIKSAVNLLDYIW